MLSVHAALAVSDGLTTSSSAAATEKSRFGEAAIEITDKSLDTNNKNKNVVIDNFFVKFIGFYSLKFNNYLLFNILKSNTNQSNRVTDAAKKISVCPAHKQLPVPYPLDGSKAVRELRQPVRLPHHDSHLQAESAVHIILRGGEDDIPITLLDVSNL